MAKINVICTKCKSDNVVCDAWAAWDFDTQTWVVENTFDQTFCNTCEGECSTEVVEVTTQ